MAARWAAIFLGMTGLLYGLRSLQQALLFCPPLYFTKTTDPISLTLNNPNSVLCVPKMSAPGNSPTSFRIRRHQFRSKFSTIYPYSVCGKYLTVILSPKSLPAPQYFKECSSPVFSSLICILLSLLEFPPDIAPCVTSPVTSTKLSKSKYGISKQQGTVINIPRINNPITAITLIVFSHF